VDAHDRETVISVCGVPRLEVGEGAQAVDARVGPEVEQDDSPAKLGERERIAALGVDPGLDPADLGSTSRRHRSGLVACELRELTPGGGASLDTVLEGLRVGGHRGCEALRCIEGDGERREADHDACTPPEPARVPADHSHSRGQTLAADRKREERQRVAERVRHRDEHHAPGDLAGRRQGGNGGEDGAGAGHHYDAGRHTEDEAVRLSDDRPSSQEEKWALERTRDTFREQRGGEEHQ
jgi:hypothetical protein